MLKSFVLISGKEKNWGWSIEIKVMSNGSFINKGNIRWENYITSYKKQREWRIKNRKSSNEYHQRWRKNNQHYMDYTKEWRKKHPKASKRISKKHSAKRRQLGFNELNTHFNDSESHHIDKENIVYIPTGIHRKIKHNIWTGEGMEEINSIAMMYAIPQ